MKTTSADTVSIAARRARVMYVNRPHVSEHVHQLIVTAVVAAEVWHWERQIMEKYSGDSTPTPGRDGGTA